MFVGTNRSLQSHDNKFLCREKNKGGQIVWDRPAAKEWETWEIEQVEPDLYAFKSLCDSCYITVQKDGSVVANSKTMSPEARFRIEEMSPGSYVIKTPNGKFLKPQPSHAVKCDSTTFDNTAVVRIHPYFQFDGAMRSFFCPAHKTWFCSEKSLNLVCDRPKPAQWESFTIEKHGNKYAFKSYHGRYVTLPKGGDTLQANATSVGPNEMFDIRLTAAQSPSEASVLIYAPNGKLLTAMKDGKAVKAFTNKVGGWEPLTIAVAPGK